MKKIIKFLIAISIICYFNDNNIKSEASTKKYQIVTDLQPTENYNMILNSGYYLFINGGCEFTPDMIIGDARKDCDFCDTAIKYQEYISISPNDEAIVDEMLNEYYSYFGVNLEERNCDAFFLFVKVNSYAVFDPNTSNLDHLEVFYASTSTINTDVTISGNKTHIIDIESPLSLNDIKSRYKATDKVDGDITNQIIFISNYDETNIKPGSYYLLMYVADKAGNTTYSADKILVKDFTRPVTSIAEDTIEIEVGTVFTLTDALDLFTYTDNFSSLENLRKHIIVDHYSNKYDIVGDYYIEAYCIDEGGNESEPVGLNIKIVDSQKPEVYLSDQTNRIETYEELTNEQILDLLSITDNYYSYEELTITINNTSDGSQGKDFIVTVTVSDPSNNTTTKEYFYYIFDTEFPIINVSNAIYLQEGIELTNAQLLELLKDVGILNDEAIDITITNTTNEDNTEIINYTATLSNGLTIDGSFMINYYPKPNNPNNNNIHILLIISIFIILGSSTYAIIKKYY